MGTTNTQILDAPATSASNRTSEAVRRTPSEDSPTSTQGIVRGLGWFSVGLGAAELLAPGLVAKITGVSNSARNRRLLRSYGVRELAAGIGILSNPRPTGWLWGRVAGDALDLTSLAAAFGNPLNGRIRVALSTVSVIGVTALDVISARQLSNGESRDSNKKATRAARAIGIDRSPEEAYRFWRNFENLPTFMTYLESVRSTGDRRSHWVANGPMGSKIEWDAEVVSDEPNRLISWRSVNGATFPNTGSVRFESAPGGRGTVVKAELNYAPQGGPLDSAIGSIIGEDIGSRIQHDLRNFKQMLELGEVTQSDASIHSGMHPAHPPEGSRG